MINKPDRWFYFPIIGLALCLVLKIIHVYISFSRYPFNGITDLNRRMLYLFFLNEYGFHQLVNDAYHHIILFKDYPPGWYYFTLPFYIVTKDLLVAIFLSILAILLLGFLFTYFLNKNLTPIQRVAFFLFFFANLQMIDYFQIGRYPEMLGWVIFIPFFFYITLYKKRKVDFKFFLITSLLFSALILTYVYIAALSSIVIVSLFLIKDYKEKLKIFFTVLTSFAVTSFWWIPFLEFMKSSVLNVNLYIKELLHKGSIVSYNTVFILGLFLIAFFYIKQIKDKKNSKEVMFILPSLILGFFVITRIIIFIPVFNRIPATPYNIYFVFLAIYLFFQTDFEGQKIKKIIPWVLIFLTLISLVIFYFRITAYSSLEEEYKLPAEIISFFPTIQENFFIFDVGATETYLTEFARINYNLSTPGVLHAYNTPEESELKVAFENRDCYKLNALVQELNLRNLVSYDQGCDVLMGCGFDERLHNKRACLYSPKSLS